MVGQGLTWNEVARKFHSPSSAPAAPTLDVLLVSQLRSHHSCLPPAAELPGPSCMMSLLHCRCRDAIHACLCLIPETRSTRHLWFEGCSQVDSLQRRTAGACLQCAYACLSSVGAAQRCCPKMHTQQASGRVPVGQSGWLSAPAEWEVPSRRTGICRAAPWVRPYSCMGLSSSPASHNSSHEGGRLVGSRPCTQCYVHVRCLAAEGRLTNTSC